MLIRCSFLFTRAPLEIDVGEVGVEALAMRTTLA